MGHAIVSNNEGLREPVDLRSSDNIIIKVADNKDRRKSLMGLISGTIELMTLELLDPV